MNAAEIEEALSALAEHPFDPAEFPYSFLSAFGNKETTIKRLRSGATNKSDIGGVLQTNNIHIAVAVAGQVTQTLAALKASPTTAKAKARFILATDGDMFEAEDLDSGETVACAYPDFSNHFGFFLPLAGLSYTKEIKEIELDMRAARRLNRLYRTLLEENPDWDVAERRPDMNHFFARLIFCFFAEDTDIFPGSHLFTSTVEKMSADSSNTREVIETLFRAMNTPTKHEGQMDDRYRKAAGIPRWAYDFPYVNGGLFSGDMSVPKFSRIARSYLIHIGNLKWTEINPDIFGSMIQAVADDEERGALGMHYTSRPNILKVLNPLFLDDLRTQLEEAGENGRKLLNLRNRMSRIRVFDPACGSGNFLVIAYKEMREIEAEINKRRDEADRVSDIPLTNFRGIELRHFPAEIARLALIIAEFQCNTLYRGKQLALAEFLPLASENWITCGNALRLDWLSICPPSGTGVKLHAEDLLQTPLDQTQIDFENEGGEIYICSNPPYLGFTWQSPDQKADLQAIFDGRTRNWKSLDYVAGWFMKAADYGAKTNAVSAFVSTNSICQGEQVPMLWPLIFGTGHEIAFAHTSFKWANLASHKAGVTVVIVGISKHAGKVRRLFSLADDGSVLEKQTERINAYLVLGPDVIVTPISKSDDGRGLMEWGNKATDGGNFFFTSHERDQLLKQSPAAKRFIKRFLGAQEFIRGQERYCLWIGDDDREEAEKIPEVLQRIEAVAKMRSESKAAETRPAALFPHKFRQIQSVAQRYSLVVARVSSENREYLPIGLEGESTIIGDRNFALYDAPLWNMAVIASRLHWVWIGTVCVRMRTDFSYSNTLGWNTFPIPTLTDKNKADLTHCAEDILLAREHYFPATIADMYDPERMDSEFPLVREAHEHNDEVLERIYVGRRFKNDTERLEKLFDLYTKMTATKARSKGAA